MFKSKLYPQIIANKTVGPQHERKTPNQLRPWEVRKSSSYIRYAIVESSKLKTCDQNKINLRQIKKPVL